MNLIATVMALGGRALWRWLEVGVVAHGRSPVVTQDIVVEVHGRTAHPVTVTEAERPRG